MEYKNDSDTNSVLKELQLKRRNKKSPQINMTGVRTFFP